MKWASVICLTYLTFNGTRLVGRNPTSCVIGHVIGRPATLDGYIMFITLALHTGRFRHRQGFKGVYYSRKIGIGTMKEGCLNFQQYDSTMFSLCLLADA